MKKGGSEPSSVVFAVGYSIDSGVWMGLGGHCVWVQNE